MKKLFAEADWIWYAEIDEPDTYGDFIDKINLGTCKSL